VPVIFFLNKKGTFLHITTRFYKRSTPPSTSFDHLQLSHGVMKNPPG
jgi:hypothetical protein